jgi:hypothetical protein
LLRSSSLFYNDASGSNASGSKGADDGLRERYLQLRQVRRVRERQGTPLLHELHTLALCAVLNTPDAATTVHASCRRPALAPDEIARVTRRD